MVVWLDDTFSKHKKWLYFKIISVVFYIIVAKNATSDLDRAADHIVCIF